jgi:hypothetical protein
MSNRSASLDERQPDSYCRIDLDQLQDALLAMTGPMCLLCEDEGWVCERHPDQFFRIPRLPMRRRWRAVPQVQSLKPRRSTPATPERLRA